MLFFSIPDYVRSLTSSCAPQEGASPYGEQHQLLPRITSTSISLNRKTPPASIAELNSPQTPAHCQQPTTKVNASLEKNIRSSRSRTPPNSGTSSQHAAGTAGEG